MLKHTFQNLMNRQFGTKHCKVNNYDAYDSDSDGGNNFGVVFIGLP